MISTATSLYRLYLHPLRHYPGPLWWAVSRLPWLFSTIRGTIIHDLKAFHDAYGPVVRVAPNEVSYTTPDATKAIYQANPELPKDPMHLPPFHNGRPGILAADHDDHRRYRRLLSGAFSDRGMRAQQAMIQSHVDLLITRLKERCGGPTAAVDMCEWYNWTTFDIIGDLAFGESFGCLEHAATHQWIAGIQGNVKAIPVVNAIRRFGLDWAIPLLAPKRLLAMRARNAQFTADQVDRRRRHGAEPRGDLWDGMIQVGGGKGDDDGAGGTMTREEMVSNASAIVVAGSETSATLLSGCTWLLLQPENRGRLRRLAEHVRGSFASEDEIDLISVGRLDYMLAVIDEALRLYPPVPMQSNRVVREGGEVIAGGWVPGGVSFTSVNSLLSAELFPLSRVLSSSRCFVALLSGRTTPPRPDTADTHVSLTRPRPRSLSSCTRPADLPATFTGQTSSCPSDGLPAPIRSLAPTGTTRRSPSASDRATALDASSRTPKCG